MKKVYSLLTDREKNILGSRLLGKGYEEIAKEYGVTRERVIQLEKESLQSFVRAIMFLSFEKLVKESN